MPFNAMTSGGFMIVVTDNSLNYSKIAYFRGQIASDCLFDFLNFPKSTEKFDKFLPKDLKSGQIIREMSLNTLNSPYDHI